MRNIGSVAKCSYALNGKKTEIEDLKAHKQQSDIDLSYIAQQLQIVYYYSGKY